MFIRVLPTLLPRRETLRKPSVLVLQKAVMKENNNIRIVDIARMTGVSAGTVDRVIHNRGRVSAENKEKIEKVLREIGYEPNFAARTLASKKEYPIAVVAPSYEGASYWEMVGQGIEKAADELRRYNVSVDFFRFDQYDRTSFPSVRSILENNHYKGVIIATLFEEAVKEMSAELDALQLPYVYIDSEIGGQNDAAYFGVDAHRSGYIAGKLLTREVGADAEIVVAHIKFIRKDISLQMRAREEGLLKYLEEAGHRGEVTHLELDPNATGESISVLENYLSQVKNRAGMIVLNSRVYELARMLDDIAVHLREKVVAAGFEAIPPNVEALAEGNVAFLISQRPERQGYDAVKALGQLLVGGQKPGKVNFMPIDILIPESVEYYNNYKL